MAIIRRLDEYLIFEKENVVHPDTKMTFDHVHDSESLCGFICGKIVRGKNTGKLGITEVSTIERQWSFPAFRKFMKSHKFRFFTKEVYKNLAL